MPITDWPTEERPREKLLKHGANSLSDAELLAIFIHTGTRGQTAIDLGRLLLQKFGGLRQVTEAHMDDFCQANGLGLAKYVQLQAAVEITKRYLLETLQRKNVLTTPQDTYRYLTICLRHYQHEVFACLFLDNAHRVICFEELFQGTIHSADIHPREVVKRALSHNAAAIIFAHNHPSGIATPSEADLAITRQLQEALMLVDIRVLDHIIIGDGEIVSLAEQGYIS